ncbi:MAG: hypothetical protein JNL05_04745 [Flavobacteriales bacterium]|nr:hypothetical protein [Flavobacteriales bacterium]
MRLINRSIGPLEERVLLLPRDPEVWYADALRIRLRHGLLGYAVVLDREVVISKDRRLLPERYW